MARPLRIEKQGGRYHVTARGNEKRDIYRDKRDRLHFLQLLAELPERFGTLLHAYVLMPNHYHMLLETPEANLSRVGQWLNVSYSVWFNRRHQRSGHLFHGRFSAIIIEDDSNFQEVGRYIHLNPVRVTALGLDKRQRARSKLGLSAPPTAEMVNRRLQVLREWPWSSYPAYAGYQAAPAWLTMNPLSRMCGGRNPQEQQTALRTYTEDAVREGLADSPWDRLIGGVILGTKSFAEQLMEGIKFNQREQPQSKSLLSKLQWEAIIRAVEAEKGEPWETFRDRYGDWGRDVSLWLGRRHGRMKLKTLAKLGGNLDYATVGSAVSRLTRRLKRDPMLRQSVRRIESRLSNAEM